MVSLRFELAGTVLCLCFDGLSSDPSISARLVKSYVTSGPQHAPLHQHAEWKLMVTTSGARAEASAALSMGRPVISL